MPANLRVPLNRDNVPRGTTQTGSVECATWHQRKHCELRLTTRYRPGTNAQRTVTVAETVCSPGSIGVDAFAAVLLRATSNMRGGATDVDDTSSKLPSDPPAA